MRLTISSVELEFIHIHRRHRHFLVDYYYYGRMLLLLALTGSRIDILGHVDKQW